jgi:N-acyl-D-amino-acid deacylase
VAAATYAPGGAESTALESADPLRWREVRDPNGSGPVPRTVLWPQRWGPTNGRAIGGDGGKTEGVGMYDLIVRGGTLVDGTGAKPQTADVGVRDGRVVEIGRIAGHAARDIDADGLVVTPGFVDIHTHFDGQATWDPILAPSAWHGVTSVAMGNCGVGFAPARPDRHDWLISLMEGVEDIPGAALAEGLSWDWESFPDYMDALARVDRSLDVGVHVPHAALRAYVMGDRGADPTESPNDGELARMVAMLSEGIAAGAVGMGTSRTEMHRSRAGNPIGTLLAARRELVALASALRDTHGVIQMISDCYHSTDSEYVAGELRLIEAMAEASGRPLSFTVQQPWSLPDRWRELQDWAASCAARDLDVWTQVAPRPIGVLMGLSASVQPFARCPSYGELAALPLADRVVALAVPETKARIIEEHREIVAQLPTTGPGSKLMRAFDLMFRLDDPVDYDIRPETSLEAAARLAGVDPAEFTYDTLLELGGHRLIYSPLYNFARGNLSDTREMIGDPRSLFGLSDAGAHCGAISDGSFTTSYLTLWARDRADRFPIEEVVPRISRDTARHLGWDDRGTLEPGMLADINVIDLGELNCAPPEMVSDLPAGGSRLLQSAYGYLHTIKAGVGTFEDGKHTGELPGRLVRGARPKP